VPWDQIVKGYEYEKDKFVVLKDEDFKRVDLEAPSMTRKPRAPRPWTAGFSL